MKRIWERLPLIVDVASNVKNSISLPNYFFQSNNDLPIADLLVSPKISVITPTYNTNSAWLLNIYEDLCSQTEQAWEWCIVDDNSTNKATQITLDDLRSRDSRIKFYRNVENCGISESTNKAVSLSTAEFVLIVDHDDRLSRDIISQYLCAFDSEKADILYCDEAKIFPDGSIGDYYYKPDFSPEHLCSAMYMLHCLGIRKRHFLELGGYRSAFDGSQDHDFVLRALSSNLTFYHIDKLLYFWRVTSSSVASGASAKSYANERGRRAVDEYLCRSNIPGCVECTDIPGIYRVRPVLSNKSVDLIILTAGSKGMVRGNYVVYVENFVSSIVKKTSYKNYIINVFINKNQAGLKNNLHNIDKRVKCFDDDFTDEFFNFSKKVNASVRRTTSDCLVLLNDDMEVISEDWLDAIVEPLMLPNVGVVGGKLLYEDDHVQHAGIVLGLEGPAGHIFRGLNDSDIGYQGQTHMVRNYSAVTGALQAFTRQTFDYVGGYNEDFPLDFNDVDFCLRVIEKGKRIVYTPFSKLYHFESKTAVRFKQDHFDREDFRGLWSRLILRDPYYNKNLSKSSPNCEYQIENIKFFDFDLPALRPSISRTVGNLPVSQVSNSRELYDNIEGNDISSVQHVTELFAFDGYQFIEICYKTFLHRTPDEAGARYYLGRLALGFDKASVLSQIIESPEAVDPYRIRGVIELSKISKMRRGYVSRILRFVGIDKMVYNMVAKKLLDT